MNRKVGFSIIGLVGAVGAGIYWVLSHCSHKYSRPFAWKKGKLKFNYVVCLNCGKEFRYDMRELKVLERIKIDSLDVMGNPEVQ